MASVEFNDTNLGHCRCPYCPVQADSKCSIDGLEKIAKGEKVAHDSFPKLYCAHGKAACDDLKGEAGCLCPSCLVWNDNDLSNDHYCLKGNAEKVN